MLDEVVKTTDTYKAYVTQTKSVMDEQAARIASLEAQLRASQAANQQQQVAIQAQQAATQAQIQLNGQQAQQIANLTGQVSQLTTEKAQQAAQLNAKFSTTIQGIVLPISNIRRQVNINGFGGVSGYNVMYTLHHPNGTTEEVRRTWRVFAVAPESRLPKRNTSVVEPLPANQIPALLTRIKNWETKPGNSAVANINIDFCGARLL